MRALAVAVPLLASAAALAGSPEDAYLAERDRDIKAVAKVAKAKDTSVLDALQDKDLAHFEQRLKAIVGPVSIAGFPAEGKINLGALTSLEEGFGTLDGLVYGEGDKSVVVTTDGLFGKWLAGHRDWWSKGDLPPAAVDAVKIEAFYTQAVNTDAAIVIMADIPVDAPRGAKFVHAILAARTQDTTPNTPEEVFVVLAQSDRVFIANEKLATPVASIAACDAITAGYERKAKAADDKAGTDDLDKNTRMLGQADKLRAKGDAAFCACFKEKVKGVPAFKAATEQVAAIVAALTR